MQQPAPKVLDIVLVGGGHSHVLVLKHFASQPEPGLRLTLICRDTHTPYSGMLPGYIAGHYGFDDVHINLHRLAHYAGARLVADEAIGIDRINQTVLCRTCAPVQYHQLSINIGSAPQLDRVAGAAEYAVPVKPIDRFNDRWQALLMRVMRHKGGLRLAVIGGGAGGVELMLAMQYRLRHELLRLGRQPQQLRSALFTRSAVVLPTHNIKVRKHFHSVLLQRGIAVHCGTEITAVENGRLRTAHGQWYQADEIVWVTNAGGAAWLRDTGLELDADGFIKVGDTLQSLADPKIFAAGDVATQVHHRREKAGVFAVKQGPPLAANLRAAATGHATKPFIPQRAWLALITTGDRYAVASRGGLYLAGKWVWRWKDWIDRRFMAKFHHLPPLPEQRGGPARAQRLAGWFKRIFCAR